jgi:hypothetical protein
MPRKAIDKDKWLQNLETNKEFSLENRSSVLLVPKRRTKHYIKGRWNF